MTASNTEQKDENVSNEERFPPRIWVDERGEAVEGMSNPTFISIEEHEAIVEREKLKAKIETCEAAVDFAKFCIKRGVNGNDNFLNIFSANMAMFRAELAAIQDPELSKKNRIGSNHKYCEVCGDCIKCDPECYCRLREASKSI